MAKEDKNERTGNSSTAPKPYLTLDSEADAQAWEQAKKADLQGVIEYLQLHGFDSDKRALQGHDAFFWAASHGFLEVVRHFIEDLKFCPKERYSDRTVLLAAAEGGSLDVVKYLVEKYGPSILKARDDQNCNAAHLAAKRGHLSVVTYLFEEQGFNHEEVNRTSCAAVLMAAENGHLPVVQYLVEKYGPSMLKAGGGTFRNHEAMCWAVWNGHIEVVRYLALFELNFRERAYSKTTLSLAMKSGRRETAEFLIKEIGCDPEKYIHSIERSLTTCANNLGRPIDENLVAFRTKKGHLQNLYQQYLQRQVLLMAIVADEKVGSEEASLPEGLLGLIAEQASPGYVTPDESAASVVDASKRASDEIKSVLSTFSSFLGYVQAKIEHLPRNILDPLLLLLLDSVDRQAQISTARFLGRVILNKPDLISLGQLQREINAYLEERKEHNPAMPFFYALHKISARLKSSSEKAVIAMEFFNRALRPAEEASASFECIGRKYEKVATDIASRIDQKYNDLYMHVKSDVAILQSLVSPGRTLGEYIAPHLQEILEKLDENTLLKLKEQGAHSDKIKREYFNDTCLFIGASGLAQEKKNALYEWCTDSGSATHASRALRVYHAGPSFFDSSPADDDANQDWREKFLVRRKEVAAIEDTTSAPAISLHMS